MLWWSVDRGTLGVALKMAAVLSYTRKLYKSDASKDVSKDLADIVKEYHEWHILHEAELKARPALDAHRRGGGRGKASDRDGSKASVVLRPEADETAESYSKKHNMNTKILLLIFKAVEELQRDARAFSPIFSEPSAFSNPDVSKDRIARIYAAGFYRNAARLLAPATQDSARSMYHAVDLDLCATAGPERVQTAEAFAKYDKWIIFDCVTKINTVFFTNPVVIAIDWVYDEDPTFHAKCLQFEASLLTEQIEMKKVPTAAMVALFGTNNSKQTALEKRLGCRFLIDDRRGTITAYTTKALKQELCKTLQEAIALEQEMVKETVEEKRDQQGVCALIVDGLQAERVVLPSDYLACNISIPADKVPSECKNLADPDAVAAVIERSLTAALLQSKEWKLFVSPPSASPESQRAIHSLTPNPHPIRSLTLTKVNAPANVAATGEQSQRAPVFRGVVRLRAPETADAAKAFLEKKGFDVMMVPSTRHNAVSTVSHEISSYVKVCYMITVIYASVCQ